MIVCPKCNKELEDGVQFCDGCGAAVTEPVPADAAAAAPKKKFPKKALLFGGIAVLVLTAVILAVVLLAGRKSGSYAVYARDGQLYVANAKGETLQLTEEFEDRGEFDSLDVLGEWVRVSEDGKWIFYPDHMDSGANLYYRNLQDPDAEPVKIDSDIASGVVPYWLNDSATLVTYKKDGSVYQYNVKDDKKEKIASDLAVCSVSDDGEVIILASLWNGTANLGENMISFPSEVDLYRAESGKDKEKIASNVTEVWYLSEGFDTFWYLKDNELYMQKNGEDRVKIGSDVYQTLRVYESGEVYYTKGDDKSQSLYYYNGKEETKLADAYTEFIDGCRKAPVLLYRSSEKTYAAVKGQVTEIENVEDADVNMSGATVYFRSETGDLYRMPIKEGTLGEAELYDSDVYFGTCMSDQYMYFKNYSITDSYKGDAYIDGELIGEDVDVDFRSINWYEEQKLLVYFSNCKSKDGKRYGTLNIYRGNGEVEKIADDAVEYFVMQDGSILYLGGEYDFKRWKGTLYRWENGDVEKIDEDVYNLIPIGN